MKHLAQKNGRVKRHRSASTSPRPAPAKIKKLLAEQRKLPPTGAHDHRKNAESSQTVIRFGIDPELSRSSPKLVTSLGAVLGRLEQVNGCGRQWSACCPAHADSTPSLSVGVSDDNQRILVSCHAGCATEHVLDAIGMRLSELFVASRARNGRPFYSFDAPVEDAASKSTNCLAKVASKNSNPKSVATVTNWSKWAQKYEQALAKERLKQLAADICVPPEDLKKVRVGWQQRGDEPSVYTFPECDGYGTVIGIATRTLRGEKKVLTGSHRGLTLTKDWSSRIREASRIFIVEGPSDVAAAWSIGIFAVGRPGARGGLEFLVQLLKSVRQDQEIVVMGEYDAKPDGTWPGRDGAEELARKLANQLRRKIGWAFPPGGAKDLREWLKSQKEKNT
jgi:hypothetical protein